VLIFKHVRIYIFRCKLGVNVVVDSFCFKRVCIFFSPNFYFIFGS